MGVRIPSLFFLLGRIGHQIREKSKGLSFVSRLGEIILKKEQNRILETSQWRREKITGCYLGFFSRRGHGGDDSGLDEAARLVRPVQSVSCVWPQKMKKISRALTLVFGIGYIEEDSKCPPGVAVWSQRAKNAQRPTRWDRPRKPGEQHE